MSNKLVAHCGCGNTGDFARDAFAMLFSNEEEPTIIDSRIQLKGLIKKHPEYEDEMRALVNAEEPYAYCFALDEIAVWDLLQGVRVR